mgnify:CR=1 FL=1
MLSDRHGVQGPNGTPPPAVTIHVLPTAQGQSIQVSHGLQGGWAAAVQVLLGALQIAIAQERHAREPEAQPPLIQLPNVALRRRPDRG